VVAEGGPDTFIVAVPPSDKGEPVTLIFVPLERVTAPDPGSAPAGTVEKDGSAPVFPMSTVFVVPASDVIPFDAAPIKTEWFVVVTPEKSDKPSKRTKPACVMSREFAGVDIIILILQP
jgi:hypothetical protein